MNKKLVILSSFFMLVAILLGIRTYVVLAQTEKLKIKNDSLIQTTIEDRTIVIGSGGMAKILGAKVVSIYDTDIYAEVQINNEPIEIIISTDIDTKIYKNGTSTAEFSSVLVDDFLDVIGNFVGFAKNISISAQEIRAIDSVTLQSRKENIERLKNKSKVEEVISEKKDDNKDTATSSTPEIEISIPEIPNEEATTTPEVQDTMVESTTETVVQDVSNDADLSEDIQEPVVDDVITTTTDIPLVSDDSVVDDGGNAEAVQ